VAKPNFRKIWGVPFRAHGRTGTRIRIGLTEIMPPATLHGVGIITKLYFVVFAAFKKSMTLNLA